MNQPIEDGEPHGRAAAGPLDPHRGLVVGLTLAAILLSFATSLSFRSEHFQELDSYSVYAILQDPKESALSYTSWSYLPAVWGSPSRETREADHAPMAARIVDDWMPDWALETLRRQPIFERFYRARAGPDIDARTTAEIRAFLVAQLENDERLKRLPLHGLYRFGLIIGVSKLPLPDFVRRVLLFPLASTYSFGQGFIYSTVFEFSDSYDGFLGDALFITLFLFYSSAVLLFLAFIRIRINSILSSLIVIWYIFSISNYSYAFHLGSTIWSSAAAIIFLYVAASAWDSRRFHRWLSWTVAVLILFSYIVIVYYIAALVIEFLRKFLENANNDPFVNRVLSVIRRMLLENWVGFAVVFVVATFFLQPGQGVRGALRSMDEVPDYLFFSVLNYVALVNNVQPLNVAQFVVVAAAFVSGAIVLGRRAIEWGLLDEAATGMAVCVTGVYLGFVLFGLLNLTPTRHIMFLAPVFFAILAAGIDAWITAASRVSSRRARPARLPVRTLVGVVYLIGWASAGFAAQQIRFNQVVDPTTRIAVPLEVRGVVGNGHPVAWRSGKPVLRGKDIVQAMGRYLYVSTDEPFASWLTKERSRHAGADRVAKVEDLLRVESTHRFSAFTLPTDDGRFAFVRPNSLYVTLFEVVDK